MVGPAFTELACRLAGTVTALALCLFKSIPLAVILAGFPISGLVLVALSLRNANMHGARLGFHARWREVWDAVRGAAPFTVCEALGQFYMRVDLLLIVFLLGKATGGWYATDIKIVEVGLMPLFDRLSGRFNTGFLGETTAYIGLPLLLITALFARSRWREFEGKLLVYGLAIVLICSLGPRLIVRGEATRIHLPWALFQAPIINNAGTGRFMIYAFLALAVIAALWLSDRRYGRTLKIGLGASP